MGPADTCQPRIGRSSAGDSPGAWGRAAATGRDGDGAWRRVARRTATNFLGNGRLGLGFPIQVVRWWFDVGNAAHGGKQRTPVVRDLQTAIAVDSGTQWLQLRCQWTRLIVLFKTQVVSTGNVTGKVVRWCRSSSRRIATFDR